MSYDKASDTYAVSVPGIGSGTLMQVSPLENGKFRSTVAGLPTSSKAFDVIDWFQPSSGTQYSYVSLATWSANVPDQDSNYYQGVMAVTQRTAEGEVPITGTASYTGDIHASIAGNTVDFIDGMALFNFDFLTATLSGRVGLTLRCMMGCDYPSTVYDFKDTAFVRGATSFSGKLAAANVNDLGQFSGVFAGPGATELAAQFQVPYLYPDRKELMTASGMIVAKKN